MAIQIERPEQSAASWSGKLLVVGDLVNMCVWVSVGEWCVSVFNVKAIWANLSRQSAGPGRYKFFSCLRPEVTIIIPMLLCN